MFLNCNFLLFAILLLPFVNGNLQWSECSVITGSPSSATNLLAQCANISVPLIWNISDLNYFGSNSTITIGLKRIFYSAPTPQQIFFVAGGPGESFYNEGFENVAVNLINISLSSSSSSSLSSSTPTIYLADHRGTGISSPLICSQNAATWSECLDEIKSEYGIEYYKQFTTTHASLDFRYVISLVQQDSAEFETYMYGVSYGTYVCNRYLTLQSQITNVDWPKLATVVMDGVIDSLHIDFHEYDQQMNAVGSEMAARCEADFDCSTTFNFVSGGETGGLLSSLYFVKEGITRGYTPQNCTTRIGLTDPRIFSVISSYFISSERRVLLPPFIARILRCSESDVEALENLVQKTIKWERLPVERNPAPYTPGYPVGTVLSASELYGPDPLAPQDCNTSTALLNSYAFGMGISTSLCFIEEIYGQYNASYPVPSYLWQLPENLFTNVLLINGDADPQTPLFGAVNEFKGLVGVSNTSTVGLVVLPNVAHQTIEISYLKITPPNFPPTTTCAQLILLSLLQNNGDISNIDTTCIDNLAENDWMGTTAHIQQISQQFFGTTDMWGLN